MLPPQPVIRERATWEQLDVAVERNARLIVQLRKTAMKLHRVMHVPHTSFFFCEMGDCPIVRNLINNVNGDK